MFTSSIVTVLDFGSLEIMHKCKFEFLFLDLCVLDPDPTWPNNNVLFLFIHELAL